MNEISRTQLGEPPARLSLRGRRPYLKKPQASIPLEQLDQQAVDRAIDAGARLQKIGLRVRLGVIDPRLPAEKLPSNLVPGEVVLYKEDLHRDTATIDVPFCQEAVREGLSSRSVIQRIQNVPLSHIVAVGI